MMQKTAKTFKFKKTQKFVLGVAFIILIAIIMWSFYKKEVPISKKDGEIIEKTTEDGGTIIEVKETMSKPVEEEFPLTLKDYEIGNAIHAMSHQKVKAKDKWSFLPLTANRVERLIEVVEINKSDYPNSKLYLNILTRWSKNDFSQIDEDHNKIWGLQNGNIGRATGILSHEEELKFIEKYYD